MTIVTSTPLQKILGKLRRPSQESRPDPRREHETLASVIYALDALLGGEIHEETIDSVGTIIPHQLRRRPDYRIILRQDADLVLYDVREQWNDQKVVMKVTAGTMNVVFYLFALFACVLAPSVRAAERATVGCAQRLVSE